MNTPKISVIVPVYNAERWLGRCVDSILAQTFTDFELLLVDDGSRDSSGAICDRYAASDPRVRVFHKPNGGVSSARNLGLDNARGTWITFCDSDDEMCPANLEDLAKFPQYDFRANHYRCNNGEWEHQSLPDKNFDGNAEIAECIATFFNYYFRMPWDKRYRADIINKHNIRFNREITIGEDLIFNLEYLSYVGSISLSSYVGTIYFRGNEDSLTRHREKYTPIEFMDGTFSGVKALESRMNQDLSKLLFDLCLFDFSLAIERIALNKESLRKKARKLKELMLLGAPQSIIKDKHLIVKGRRKKLLDFLLGNRLYIIAAKFIEHSPSY